MKPTSHAMSRIARVAAVVVLAVFFWSVNRRVETKPASTIISVQSTLVGRALSMQASHQPLVLSVEKIDVVREQLRAVLVRWHEIKTGDTAAQEQLTAELVALLTDDNVAGIAQSLSADDLGTPFGLAALTRWMELDAAAAGTWIAARADATDAQALLVARALLKEPARFREFCDGLPDTEWKQTLLSAGGLERVPRDPAGAIELALRMEPGSAQTNVLQTAAYDWMTRDPLAASAWIGRMDDAALREQLLAVGAKALASTDPDLATGWLAEIKSDGVLHDTALCVVEGWVARDPAGAADWVARIPAPGLRDAAVELVARQWLQSDSGAATAWLENLPERDAMLARLEAGRAGVDDPADLE